MCLQLWALLVKNSVDEVCFSAKHVFNAFHVWGQSPHNVHKFSRGLFILPQSGRRWFLLYGDQNIIVDLQENHEIYEPPFLVYRFGMDAFLLRDIIYATTSLINSDYEYKQVG